MAAFALAVVEVAEAAGVSAEEVVAFLAQPPARIEANKNAEAAIGAFLIDKGVMMT
ncbi:hypothetical protein GCM10027189_16780 [Rufibacter soli]